MNLIVAADENWGIGREGRLLFQLSPDLKKFKARTLYGTVIMGRKTLESLPGGRPLKNRINIVLSRTLTQPQAAPAEERVLICRDLSELKSRLAALEHTGKCCLTASWPMLPGYRPRRRRISSFRIWHRSRAGS